MKLAVLFALLGSAFCAGTQGHASGVAEPPLWANEDMFGNYQDAWKSLNQSETTIYWLVVATFDDDQASWGKNFTCLRVNETNKNETEKSVTSVFTFRNSSGDQEYTVREKVKAVFSYNYTNKENAIQYTLQNGTTLNDTLIFSDGETCDLFSVPYMNGGKGCELWVNGKNVDNIPQCCLFAYKFFCNPRGIKNHWAYKKTCARNHK
ncbi:female-specific histamine-binding protein 2-like [Amblyomma americanum]